MNRVEITVVNATPLLVGWYRPELPDPRGLRATEIKGIWRWWARAFVGGALFDLGLLKGSRTKDVLLAPTKDEIECVAKIVGEELGLGMAMGRVSRPSKFSIVVEPLEGPTAERLKKDKLGEWKEAQRIKLLGLKAKGEQEYEEEPKEEEQKKPWFEKSPFKLVVEWSKDFGRQEVAIKREVAIKILLVALQFNGIGKGSRRGLGSLDIVSIESSDQQLKSNLDLPEASSSTDKTDKKIDKLSKLIKDVYDKCSEIVKKKYEKSEDRIPPFPVISKKTIKQSPVSSIKVFGISQDKFVNVHDFFVRSKRCKVLRVHEDNLKQMLLAWFLGLPRAQKRTGYFIMSKGVTRRASPVILAFHTENNLFGSGAFVSTFISGDWPLKLEWRSDKARREEIEINEERILKAYTTFRKEFEDYIRNVLKQSGTFWRDLWP